MVGHHHGSAAIGIDVVVLAIPKQAIKIGPGLLQPLPELPLFFAGVQPQIQLQPLGHGQGRLQRGDPEGTAIGTYPLQGPVVKGLVGGTAIIGETIIIDIKLLEIPQCLERGRPTIRQKLKIFTAGGKPESAPYLQHKIAGKIFPEIAILVSGVIGCLERTLVRGAEIVGGGARQLARGFHPTFALGEVPADRPQGGIGGRNRPGEIQQDRLIQFRPKLQQRQGAVETHIQTFVPGVVEALEHPEVSDRRFLRSGRPEAAATGQVVELVE